VDEHRSVAHAGGEDPIEVDAESGLDLVEEGGDEADVVVTRTPIALSRLPAFGWGRVVDGTLAAGRAVGPWRGVAREVVPRGDQLAAGLEAGSLWVDHHVAVLVGVSAE
jgi:hypothetical protein